MTQDPQANSPRAASENLDMASLACLQDYEQLARTRLTPDVWSYIQSGAADGITAQKNQDAFKACALRPRVLCDMHGGDAGIELLGHRYASPIWIAPMAYHQLVTPEGEMAAVKAASALNMGCVISTQSSITLEELASQSATPLWFQLYMQADWAITQDLISRAEQAGYAAIVVTVDAPIQGFRNADQRTGFQLPAHIQPVNLAPYANRIKPPQAVTPGGSVFEHPLVKEMPGWESLEKLIAHTRLPVLVKGILHPEDAVQAIALGAAGIIVSNHGGRVLDTVQDSFSALPGVAEAVAGKVPLLVDGGIRRGTDILKCLARGADAVLLGRPVLHGAAVAGASGVAHVLHLLKSELEMAMALCGMRCLNDAQQQGVVS